MCEHCGCESENATIINLQTGRRSTFHVHADGAAHWHSHDDHAHEHHHHHHDHSHGSETVDINARLLEKNDALAARNRAWFAEHGILALNLVSSPGAGKTTLLERTIRDLHGEMALSVIEGDQATVHDGERIRAAGAPAVQVNTGTGCHLEANMIARGIAELQPAPESLLLIENVGNLVCPAMFDLGERAKIVILSTAEGEDKPLKYPHLFQAAELMLLNKIDLLPHVDFNVDRAIIHARTINPRITAIPVSARTGEGLDAWYGWLRREMADARPASGVSGRSRNRND